MGVEVSFIAAFLAGVLSISSPCVLPLMPIFLAHLAGASAGGVEGIARRRVLPNAAAYVLGFSLVFIALGVALGAAGALASTASVVASKSRLADAHRRRAADRARTPPARRHAHPLARPANAGSPPIGCRLVR